MKLQADSQSKAVPYLLTSPGRDELLECYRDGLLEDSLSFWFPRCLDLQYGGYLHYRDRDGSLLDSDKSVWAHGRMAWMLLTLFNNYQARPEWLQWAEHGLDFLKRYGLDSDGRMFFHWQRDGQPLRKRRYAYSEAFASIALAAHYRATGCQQSQTLAWQMFHHYTRWNFTPGLMPAKSTDIRPMISLAPRMIALVTAQELRESFGPCDELTAWIDRSIDDIRRNFVKPELAAVMEQVAPDGSVADHSDGRLLNPGHALEGAWFILREGLYRHQSDLIELGSRMIDWMWQRGWDHQYGGLLYFCDLDGKPPQEYWHDMKFWWPHNEAIIATLLAFEATGDARYASWHQQVHDWSHQHFADPEHGEWFGYLHRDGTLSTTTKGNLWKSCFHHPRMQWTCWQALIDRTQASKSEITRP